MENYNDARFDMAARGVCDRIRKYLRLLPRDVKTAAQEIRLRVNRPVCICCAKSTYFLTREGGVSCLPEQDALVAGKEDMEETFRNICSYSIYSHQNEIKSGFVTMSGGHRAGICGTASAAGGVVVGIRGVSSINLRIAREMNGCADGILKSLGGSLDGGLLLAGAPASGKTTLLRDLARQLSSGLCGDIRRVAVVDERGELAGTYLGEPQNDLGVCCDVLDGYPKGEGVQHALRSLSPEFILCDELGGEDDLRAVEQGLNAGVSMVSTIHAGGVRELMRRKQATALLQTGAFENVVLLDGRSEPGKVAGIYKAGDLLAEADRGDIADCGRNACGLFGVA